MRLTKITLKNWLCYRGDTELVLEAKPYAIVARHPNDVEQSNWLGKTSLLESIVFALFGAHRHRTEDEWITTGEKAGSVSLEFDNGVRVLRTRERKGTTKLWCFEGAASSYQLEAQLAIKRIVGLDEADFHATCYFKQRDMGRLVNAKPEARMAIVGGWLQLAPLVAAEEYVIGKVAEFAQRRAEVERALLLQEEIVKQNLGGAASVAELTDWETQIESTIDEQEAIVGRHQDAVARNAALLAGRENKARYDDLVERGKALRAEIDAAPAPAMLTAETSRLQENRDKLWGQVESLRASFEQKRVVARGEFDGACPVAKIVCPAKAKINEMRTENANDLRDIRTRLDAAHTAFDKASADHKTAEALSQERDRKEAHLESLRGQARFLQPSVRAAEAGGEPVPVEQAEAALREAQAGLVQSKTDALSIRKGLEAVDKATASIEKLRVLLGEVDAELTVHRAATVILGKQGAQRRLAEGALADIEIGANGMLRECGIGLSVAMSWSREGTGLARACDRCGAPYPASAKVRECPRCSAPRGANQINKLEVDISNRSGAAEDLAGAALQLAASAWLRGVRLSAWAVAMLDEPFGALDGSNRRALSQHLAGMLAGRYGFEQSFVIAHHTGALDALPGRIEITGDGVNSVARVVA